MKQLIMLMMGSLILVSSTWAQYEEGAPVKLQLSAKYILPETALFIIGQTAVGKEAVTVKISITSPENKIQTINAVTNLQGSFHLEIKATIPYGKYIVTAVGADGIKSVEQQYWVIAPQLLQETMAKEMEQLNTTLDEAVTMAEDLVKGLPPSAAKEEYMEKSAKLKTALKQEAVLYKEMKTSLGNLLDVVSKTPEVFEKTQPYLDQIKVIQEKAVMATNDFKQRMKQSLGKAANCERLNYLSELCGFTSLVLDFKGKIGAVIVNLMSDKALPGVIDRMKWKREGQSAENAKMAINTMQKTGVAAGQGYANFKEFLQTGLTLDITQFVAKALYGKFCAELKGPVTGSFTAEMDAGNGNGIWNSYEMQLKGTLTLRYEKGGDAQKGFAVSGEFEGVYTKYNFWEDFERVEPVPPLWALFERRHIKATVIDPSAISIPGGKPGEKKAELDINNDLGLIARQLLPGSFLVKVKGKVVNNKVHLQFDEQDYLNKITSAPSNQLLLVLIQPLLPIPIIRVFDFPMAPARTIFIVGLNGEQVIELTTGAGKTSGTKSLNNTRNLEGIKLQTKLNIKIGS